MEIILKHYMRGDVGLVLKSERIGMNAGKDVFKRSKKMNKSFKRIITLLLASIMITGAAGCNSQAVTTTAAATAGATTAAVDATTAAAGATTAASGELIKVAFICADMANPSQSYSSKEFQKYGKDYGFDVTVLDAKGDVQNESTLVTNSIAQGMKAIFLNPNDIKAIVPSIMQAKEAGIVVGMFSSDLAAESQQYRDFFVGVNDTMAGEAAGKAFIDKFPDGAKIVEIGGQAGHDAQIKRHDGFAKAIAGSKIEVIDFQVPQQWDTAQAMAIMEDMITKEGDQIQGVFCHWDNGVTGVIEALKAANMLEGMFIVGVDGNKNGFAQVKAGEQSVSIAQNFTTMTKEALQLARDVIDGKTVEKINFIPLDVVTKDNIDTFQTPEW